MLHKVQYPVYNNLFNAGGKGLSVNTIKTIIKPVCIQTVAAKNRTNKFKASCPERKKIQLLLHNTSYNMSIQCINFLVFGWFDGGEALLVLKGLNMFFCVETAVKPEFRVRTKGFSRSAEHSPVSL